jgi:chemotaxis protein histidine kinase CheA
MPTNANNKSTTRRKNVPAAVGSKKKRKAKSALAAGPPLKKSKIDDVPVPVEWITHPTEKDVLSGRSPGCRDSKGNLDYLQLIELQRENYELSNEKCNISRKIVEEIRKRNGRFLEMDADSQKWFDIGDKRAVLKASQRFRDLRIGKTNKKKAATQKEEPATNNAASKKKPSLAIKAAAATQVQEPPPKMQTKASESVPKVQQIQPKQSPAVLKDVQPKPSKKSTRKKKPKEKQASVQQPKNSSNSTPLPKDSKPKPKPKDKPKNTVVTNKAKQAQSKPDIITPLVQALLPDENQQSITEVRVTDVIIGRRSPVMAAAHPGNHAYQRVINHNKPRFLILSKPEKIELCKMIAAMIRSRGGRFLFYDTKSMAWSDIGNPKAIEKITQALIAAESSKLVPDHHDFQDLCEWICGVKMPVSKYNHLQQHASSGAGMIIGEPSLSDVLAESGTLALMEQHPGNLAFRWILNQNHTRFLALARNDKLKFAATIVAMIQSHGGRLLEQQAKGWLELSEAKANAMVFKAFRGVSSIPSEGTVSLLPGNLDYKDLCGSISAIWTVAAKHVYSAQKTTTADESKELLQASVPTPLCRSTSDRSSNAPINVLYPDETNNHLNLQSNTDNVIPREHERKEDEISRNTPIKPPEPLLLHPYESIDSSCFCSDVRSSVNTILAAAATAEKTVVDYYPPLTSILSMPDDDHDAFPISQYVHDPIHAVLSDPSGRSYLESQHSTPLAESSTTAGNHPMNAPQFLPNFHYATGGSGDTRSNNYQHVIADPLEEIPAPPDFVFTETFSSVWDNH